MTDFMSRMSRQLDRKRQSQKALASVLGQSPTKTESEHLHSLNVTRFGEMFKHAPERFQKALERRIAWQVADTGQRAEIMDAIRQVG